MIPFRPDPSWYQAYWYVDRPSRRIRSVIDAAHALIQRAIRRLASAHSLIERSDLWHL